MSVGGVFQLITNTGIQDRLIMATVQLKKRLKEIACGRIQKLKEEHPDKSDKDILSMTQEWGPSLSEINKTHTLFINSTYKPFVAMAHEYSRTPPRQGKPALGATFSFTLPIIGEFVNDAVLYVKLTGLAAVSALDKVRYVEYLGHRLTKQVRFKVQNHLFDQYGTDEMNVHWQFKVPPSKEKGYLKNIGQEIPKLGYLTADPTVDEVREYRWFGNGPQTFKQTQLDVEMWIPILFWFNEIKTALPNFLLPKNQTDIEVTFESEANLVSFANYGGGGSFTSPSIGKCYLYVNHLFLLPEIHKLFVSRFGFQLIRVHRRHFQEINTNEQNIRLHQLKWPVECLYVGVRPQTNLTNSQRWYKNTSITPVQVKEAVVTGVGTIQVNNAVYLNEQNPVSSLELKSHDITIYPALPPSFYSDYIPYKYGDKITTPRDPGWYMMNFNIKPSDFNPSGHLNVSRGRELYLHYLSAVDTATNQYIIRSDNPCDLIVLADCINFLYLDQGNAVLRFST